MSLRIERRALQPDRDLPADLHPVLRRVLLGRGITSARELDHALANLLPPGFSQFDRAGAELASAVMEDRRIVIVGDFDADGATATAVAMRALRAMGAERVIYCVPDRFQFGYGLSAELVEAMLAENIAASGDLLVTVDNGIGSIHGVRAATARGLATIITDHHLPGERLPDAFAIVNPNLPGEAFASKALAGVGVVFYLLAGVRAQLELRGWFDGGRKPPALSQWLDLVALGTVADMVPLDYNNRILVEQGLKRIRAGHSCCGVQALLRAGGVNHRLCTAMDLAWKLAPRLNAAGRLEDMSIGIECLLSDDLDRADELAMLLDEINTRRRDLQQQMLDEAEQQVNELERELRQQPLPAALCLYDRRWHQGIVGLVASRIKDRLHRPVLALAPANGDDDTGAALLKGSARSVPGVHIRDHLALLDCRHPGLMQGFGGHAMAAGLSLAGDRLAQFRSAWDELAGMLDLQEHVLYTDGELAPGEFDLELARLLERALPWGQKLPEPLFENHFHVRSREPLAGNHVRLVLQPLGSRLELAGIAFRQPLEPFRSDRPIRLAYRLQVNRFRGQESLQVNIARVLDQPPH